MCVCLQVCAGVCLLTYNGILNEVGPPLSVVSWNVLKTPTIATPSSKVTIATNSHLLISIVAKQHLDRHN